MLRLNRKLLRLLRHARDQNGKWAWQYDSKAESGTLFGQPYEMVEVTDDPTDDRVLAAEMVRRLNLLIKDETARDALEKLLDTRMSSARWKDLAEHPTIQVSAEGDWVTVGILGMLNGMIGAIPDGKRKGWGWFAAQYDNGRLIGFQVTA